MKYLWVAVLALSLIACQSNTQQKVELKTQKDSISYSIGMDIGKNLKTQSIDVDPSILAQGMRDILDSNKTLITEEESQNLHMTLQRSMMAKHEEMMKSQGETNRKEGEAFLAENKTKPGVVTLPDGLQYKVDKMGTGKKPDSTSTVSVNYIGKLINGTEFDNSYKRGQPAEFPVKGVIRGWTEALQLMPVGSKWTLYIPSELAYGDRGAGQAVPPGSTLIFDVELLSIKK
jgi:FKBP-type peptidyl-prolyl cis-trans isomerase FklB